MCLYYSVSQSRVEYLCFPVIIWWMAFIEFYCQRSTLCDLVGFKSFVILILSFPRQSLFKSMLGLSLIIIKLLDFQELSIAPSTILLYALSYDIFALATHYKSYTLFCAKFMSYYICKCKFVNVNWVYSLLPCGAHAQPLICNLSVPCQVFWLYNGL